MATDWDDMLLAYLHDPPDKALDIQKHEHPAAELASRAVWWDVSPQALHRNTRTEDQLAAIAERIPMPAPGPRRDGAAPERTVGVEEGKLLVFHPLSAAAEWLETVALDPQEDQRELEQVVAGLDPPRKRFLALWRLWRDSLSQRHPAWSRLPADTRQPDHTIWNHTDTAAGLQPALAGNHGAAFLSFSLGPVQSFIASARTVRDLWTGSYLLAWLTFQALRPILDDLGPAAVISPALRGVPLLDLYLREPAQGLADRDRVKVPDRDSLLSPCLPNRFTAVVPWGPDGADARQFARSCEAAFRNGWRDLCDKVFASLEGELQERHVRHAASWNKDLWDRQINSFFEVRTALLPWRECADETISRLLADSDQFKNALAVRSLAEAIPAADCYGFRQDAAGQWMGRLEVLRRLSEAKRSVRHVPDYRPSGDVPQKCSLLGTYEQMGPPFLNQSREFWDDFAQVVRLRGSRTRKNERLCAVSLVKRFAWPAFLAAKLNLNPEVGRFADTASVAAALWLAEEPCLNPVEVWKNHRKWSGQWLHWSRPDQEKEEGEENAPSEVWKAIQVKRSKLPPPTYYAVLMIDGDDMGKWLQGPKGPKVSEVLHPRLRDYYRGLPKAQRGLEARRPVGPALNATLSEAVSNFALHFVPGIVGNKLHLGELIYAGGDDVLALLPTAGAISCARQLAETFAQDWQESGGCRYLLMGRKASVSAGLAVVHYKEDLRFALEAARRAEKAAKASGKNALTLAVCRRSGEHTSATLPWSLAKQVEDLVKLFQTGVTDRWAYRLRAELPTLKGPELPWAAVRAETCRLLDRVEDARKGQLRTAAEQLLDAYHTEMIVPDRGRTAGEALEEFVTLCQSAAFLARGREQR